MKPFYNIKHMVTDEPDVVFCPQAAAGSVGMRSDYKNLTEISAAE